MRRVHLVGLASLSVLLLVTSGCQTRRGATRPRDTGDVAKDDNTTKTAKGVTIDDDADKTRIRFIGLKERHGSDPANVYLLRSWVARDTRDVSHQLYASDRYLARDERNWSSAKGPKGEKLRVTKIDKKTENCSREGCPRVETFGAALDDAALRAAASRGYAVTFAADDGSKLPIEISPLQIRAQLDAIEQKLAAMPKPKATPKPAKKPSAKPATPNSTVPQNSGY